MRSETREDHVEEFEREGEEGSGRTEGGELGGGGSGVLLIGMKGRFKRVRKDARETDGWRKGRREGRKPRAHHRPDPGSRLLPRLPKLPDPVLIRSTFDQILLDDLDFLSWRSWLGRLVVFHDEDVGGSGRGRRRRVVGEGSIVDVFFHVHGSFDGIFSGLREKNERSLSVSTKKRRCRTTAKGEEGEEVERRRLTAISPELSSCLLVEKELPISGG